MPSSAADLLTIIICACFSFSIISRPLFDSLYNRLFGISLKTNYNKAKELTMNKLKTLELAMKTENMIVTDPKMIEYLINHLFEPGERMIALLITKNKKPKVIINEMFPKPKDIEVITYKDGENSVTLLIDQLVDKNVSVDGLCPLKFCLPLIEAGFTLKNASPLLESMRAIKTKEEIDIMIQASKFNDEIMNKLIPNFKVGTSELELANLVKEFQSESPLQGISFEPIVVFTENIADPHGIPTNRKLTNQDVIIVDMGGFFQGYASDMTRCFFMTQHEELEKIYEIVLKANMAGIEAVKVGAPLSNVDKACRSVITENGYGKYFTHRTGHGIGTEVHETLDVSSSNDTLIKPGMCFSIEPGIYIDGLGGIRIEDLVYVDENGAQLMNHFPKDLESIRLNKEKQIS